MIYALTRNDSTLVRIEDYGDNFPPVLAPQKEMQWLVYIEVRPELTNDEIMGGVTDSVDFEAQTYTRTYESAVKPPPGVPRSVSPSQFRRALNAANLRSAVEAAISAADQGTKDLWEYATSVDRDNVQLNAMATVLGITQNQLDDIFIAASQI